MNGFSVYKKLSDRRRKRLAKVSMAIAPLKFTGKWSEAYADEILTDDLMAYRWGVMSECQMNLMMESTYTQQSK